MVKNIQEYINGLINKSSAFYLDLNNNGSLRRTNIYKCERCQQELSGKLYCKHQACNFRPLEGEITDLKEFTNLRGLNVANNQFTKLDFLDTLPNKDKLKNINLFGNQIQEVDFAELFTQFPNLEKINLSGNPLSAKNLDKLTNEQFAKLVNGIKDKKIRINSFKGTFLMDLLEYAQKLASQGNQQQQQHAQYLQTLIQNSNSPTKDNERPNSGKTPLLVGGLIIFGILAVAIGYFWGKKRKNQELES